MASLDELTNAGISTSFDEETLKLQIDLASTELKTQEMKLLENYDDETGALIVNPSPWSGFANIRIQQSIDKSTNSSSWLRVPVSGAVDWVNDIYSVRAVNKFLFAENTSPVLNRNESYVFYDLEKQQSRIIAGDIIPTIRSFQNSRNLLGLSYRKERELQNWWQFQNTGRKEILLNEASEIEIYLNGTLRERFQAPAGPLSIDQIPLYSGSNELKIIVRSQSGAVREITEELFHDETVLKKGESDYSFNVGTASSLDGLSRRYQTDDWYGSAYYRFGLATSFDMGMNSQISDQSFAVGIEAKKALKIGLLGTELMTYFPKDTNTAAAIRFSWNSPKAISFYSLRPYTRSYIEVYSTGFSSPLQLGIPSQKQVSVFNSVSFEAPLRLQQSIDWRRDWLHGGAHESRWGYNVRRNIMKSWSVSAGYEYLDPNESKHNFTVGLTWRETRKNLQARSFFQSRNQQSRVELLHDPDQRVQNFSQKATLQKSTDATDARLDLNYKGNRGSAELNYDYSKFVSSGN
ncbi:MAG: hypothetical protein GW917_01935, partial [Bdellovibrionales bacterium]|nr:hypothetical protein [Bdellovibrionales bacterium]